MATPPHPLAPPTQRYSSPHSASQLQSPRTTTAADFGIQANSPYHRPHAATISTTRPATQSVSVSGSYSLGAGPSYRHTDRSTAGVASKRSSTLGPSSATDGLGDILTPRSSRIAHRRKESNSFRRLGHFLDSLGREELAIAETRFDLMSDDEIQVYLQHLPSRGRTSTTRLELSAPEMPVGEHLPSTSSLGSVVQTPPQEKKSPLFPPSPPSLQTNETTPDHPLRILSRAVRELKEVIEKLEEENELLRLSQVEKKVSMESKAADQVSIHDNINEAVSTSLTSSSSLHLMTSGLSIDSGNAKKSASIRSASPAHSLRISRNLSPASLPIPLPSTPEAYSGTLEAENTRKNSKQSWTSGLWVWNNKKTVRPRINSNSSIASSHHVPPPKNPVPYGQLNASYVSDDEDDHVWRKGDGGSSPAFRAIFQATRILTPDPSSILTPLQIPTTSLTAYLAHLLVSNARDEGIMAKEPPNRRRSRELSRSRALNAADSGHGEGEEIAKDGKGYGDSALAVTSSVRRSIMSSVTSATNRSTKGTNGNETRPSLLTRGSSGRSFPAVAIASPQVAQAVTVGAPASESSEGSPLPSVELSSIVPDESRPPTVLLSRENLGSFFQSNKINKTKMATASRFDGDEPPLTDRYGFIYDIHHAKMLKDASAAGTPAPMPLNGTMSKMEDPQEEGWIAKRRRNSQSSHRSGTQSIKHSDSDLSNIPAPARSGQTTDTSKSPTTRSRSSSNAEQTRHRSSTILSLNPSPARPVTAKDHLTVSARGASSLHSGVSSPTTASGGLQPISASLSQPLSPTQSPSPSHAPSRLIVSSLLDQLTELHDRQQKERIVEWDAFLKRRAKTRSREKDQRAFIGVNQMGLSGKGQEDWKAFTRLVRRGIPLKYRSDIWAECSGAKDHMVPGEYAEILAVHKDDASPVMGDIEKDVSRTFPGNVFFGGDGPGVAKLRRVLVAYSWYNPGVGYCQGMNMLAATLLLTHTDEEQAFWVLVCLIDRHLPRNYFSSSLIGSRADQLVLSDIVAQVLPKIDSHFQELGVDLASITFGWFLSLFTDCLPVETLFRVWDLFFVEGHDSIFRVAVAILKLNETEICNCESVSDLFSFISSMTSRLWAADKLVTLQHTYKSVIRHSDVVARCEKAVESLEKDAGDR